MSHFAGFPAPICTEEMTSDSLGRLPMKPDTNDSSAKYSSAYSMPRHVGHQTALKRASSSSAGMVPLDRDERFNHQNSRANKRSRRASDYDHPRSSGDDYFHGVSSPSSSMRGSNGNITSWEGNLILPKHELKLERPQRVVFVIQAVFGVEFVRFIVRLFVTRE